MPFYFAWVNATDRVFLGAFKREDENIFKFTLVHEEGKAAELTIEIQNPFVGLLAAGRKLWAYLAYDDGSSTRVMFFGRVVAIPSNLLGETIQIKFSAMPDDIANSKLALAQLLKVRPFWDPIWVSLAKQNDSDAALEGYSKRWHIDRTDLTVSVSDILEGEDGTITLTEGQVFYDNLNLEMGEFPVIAFNVQGTITWTQRATGSLDLGGSNVQTYTGDGLVSGWPKSYTELGQGWMIGVAFAADIYNVATMTMGTVSRSYQNKAAKHEDGDTLSVNESWTRPVDSYAPIGTTGIPQFKGFHATLGTEGSATYGFDAASISTVVGYTNDGQALISDEFASDATAASISVTVRDVYVPLWLVSTTIEVIYNAVIQRREVVKLTLSSDVQQVIPAIQSTAMSEAQAITIDSLDVGQATAITAILTSTGDNVSNGDSVTVKNNVYVFQSVLTGGVGHVHIGATAAESLVNLINAINVNGVGIDGVDFALESDPNRDVFARRIDDSNILFSALSPDPAGSGVPVSTSAASLSWVNPAAYTAITLGGGFVVAGRTYSFDALSLSISLIQLTLVQHVYRQVPYHVLIGGDPTETLVNLAAAINASGGAGSTYSSGTLQNPRAIAVVVEDKLTVFPRYAGAFDGVYFDPAHWTHRVVSLIPDQNTVPIGDISRRSFVTTDRGHWAIENLICRARAQARQKARSASLSFDCLFEQALGFSCRKNAIVVDRRLPAGQVEGKIIRYQISGDGDSGQFFGSAKLGCAIGNGGTVSTVTGTPTYVSADYVGPGYQVYAGATTTLSGEDIGYTPPAPATPVFNDKLSFPLRATPDIVHGQMISDYTTQQNELETAWDAQHLTTAESLLKLANAHEFAIRKLVEALSKKQDRFDLYLTPVVGGPISYDYEIDTSHLTIPKQVDFGA